MPFVMNEGIKIYWDECGSGEPLLLIMGLSYPSYMWHRTRPVLAKNYRTIAFDNRGIGQSDVPSGVYSMPTMASDAAVVLDAVGVEAAHVFGLSMGGHDSAGICASISKAGVVVDSGLHRCGRAPCRASRSRSNRDLVASRHDT